MQIKRVFQYINSRVFNKGFLLVILTVTGLSLSAQTNNEVSLYVKGPNTKLSLGDFKRSSDIETGIGVGLNYAYAISDHWSVISGVEYQKFSGNAYFDTLTDSFGTVDAEQESFVFNYAFSQLKEQVDAEYLNIPLKVQYETLGDIRFYAAAGVKMGVTISAKSESNAGSLQTSGYYEQYNVELEAPMFMGFGDFGSFSGSTSDIDFKSNFILNFESGMKMLFDQNNSIYVGLFVDYGLNDIRKGSAAGSLLSYNVENPSEFQIGSVLNSRNLEQNTDYVDEVKTLAFGVKLRYGFSW